jgi:hypothetical protein
MASNLPFGSGVVSQCCFTGSPDPRQHPFRLSISPYPASYMGQTDGGRPSCPKFPAAFRPPTFASWVFLPPLRDSPSSRSAYRVRIHTRTSSGLSRCTRARRDRVGRLLYPGTAVFPRLTKPP